MGTKTQNYQLNQWEATDNFLRVDFNEDNAKIENALTAISASVPKITFGSYVGDGNYYGREIPLGFQASAILLMSHKGLAGHDTDSDTYGGLFAPGYPLRTGSTSHDSNDEYVAAAVTTNGFTVRSTGNGHKTNDSGMTYYYLAFRW